MRYTEVDFNILRQPVRFKQKCDAYFQALRESDTSALISTHDLDFVERHCHRTLWLRGGRVVTVGPTHEVIRAYRRGLA